MSDEGGVFKPAERSAAAVTLCTRQAQREGGARVSPPSSSFDRELSGHAGQPPLSAEGVGNALRGQGMLPRRTPSL